MLVSAVEKTLGSALAFLQTIGEMMHRLLRQYLAVLIALVCAQPLPGAANVIYTYAGHNYDLVRDHPLIPGAYTLSMRVTGTFELASPIAPNLPLSDITPLHFSFSDGRHTYTDLNTPDVEFSVGTDAIGAINFWRIVLDEGTPHAVGEHQYHVATLATSSFDVDGASLFQCLEVIRTNCIFLIEDASIIDNPGSWTVAASAAYPHLAALRCSGSPLLPWVGAVAGIRRL